MVRFEPGEVIAGRYEVIGKLASGGMASVYVATMRLARGVSRRVALKRVHPHLAEDPKFVSMFVDEARLASELSHPGIVPVLDALEVGGELILVLEYVAGWDLESILRGDDTPVDPAIALRITRMALETLAHVHDARDVHGRPLDIVHRDVSPSNILIGEDDSVRLLDFGIAKAARRSIRTATRTLKGKLAYMSPEQASGDPLDGRSDVYAMGLTLLEMLLGARVSSADDESDALTWARAPKLPPLDGIDPGIRAAALRLLEPNVAMRPHASEAARLIAELEPSGGKEATRALVLERLGCSARPLADRHAQKHSVDAALAALLDDDDDVTAVPDPTPARSLLLRDERAVPENREPENREPDLSSTAKPVRSRAPWALVAVVALALGGAFAWSSQQADADPQTPALLPSFVNVSSTPPGATILLGDADRGTTPGVVELAANDPHALTLRLDDHEDASASFDPIAGETVEVALELARRLATLSIRTDPEGASVRVNEREVGMTPLDLEGQARELVQIEIELEGHQSETREVDLDAERDASLEIELAPIDVRPGTLWVNANIPNARVEVDGRVVSRSVPWRGRARVGSRRVTVRAPDGREETRTVRVRPGAITREGFFL